MLQRGDASSKVCCEDASVEVDFFPVVKRRKETKSESQATSGGHGKRVKGVSP